jgi:hypothetical protein
VVVPPHIRRFLGPCDRTPPAFLGLPQGVAECDAQHKIGGLRGLSENDTLCDEDHFSGMRRPL